MYNISEETNKWLNDRWNKIENKLSKVAVRSRDKLPYTATDGVHNDMNQTYYPWWTNGFWGGLMWLMYLGCENNKEIYKQTALASEKMLSRIFDNFECFDHDAGFLCHLTFGADYRITGDKNAYNKNLFAASVLSSRYNIDGKYIRAWNNKSQEGITIIDTMMNLPLLYWASEVLDDIRFTRVAKSHADMTIYQHIRSDGTIFHQVRHDVNTGETIETLAGQGYKNTSCWSRGQAWAVYGMCISFIHTGERRYLDAAIKCADSFIDYASKTDYLPLVDFEAPQSPIFYDSTAGACVASALIELSKYTDESKSEKYMASAIKLLEAIDRNCCNYDENVDYLVGMGTERYPLKEDCMKGVHIPIIYGDFFYVEALLKLMGNKFFIW